MPALSPRGHEDATGGGLCRSPHNRRLNGCAVFPAVAGTATHGKDERIEDAVDEREVDAMARTYAGFGVMLPNIDPFRVSPPFLEAAGLADELGFDSGWVGDHLSFHPPVLEAVCGIAGAAGRTQRLKLGFGIMLLAMRNPVWTAKQLMAIDQLAPGRLILGIGVGGENPREFEAAGVPHAGRGKRLDEALSILPDLLAGKDVEFAGEHLHVSTAGLEPAVSALPPILVGGRSEAAHRRAARYGDAYLPVWMDPERVRESRQEIAVMAAELGRPAPAADMLVFLNVCDSAARGRAMATAFFHGQYDLPFERVERWTVIGDEAHVAERLAELHAAGVGGFVLIPTSPDVLAQYERLAGVREHLAAAGALPAGAGGG